MAKEGAPENQKRKGTLSQASRQDANPRQALLQDGGIIGWARVQMPPKAEERAVGRDRPRQRHEAERGLLQPARPSAGNGTSSGCSTGMKLELARRQAVAAVTARSTSTCHGRGGSAAACFSSGTAISEKGNRCDPWALRAHDEL